MLYADQQKNAEKMRKIEFSKNYGVLCESGLRALMTAEYKSSVEHCNICFGIYRKDICPITVNG